MINPIRSLNGKIILAIALSLTIVLGISFYLLAKYQREQLMKYMQDYSSQRIQTKTKDELGKLINSFNTMGDKLKNSQERLENFNEELQREVERKTQEIKENSDRLFKATQTFNELTLAALRDEHEAVFENPHLKKC